MTLAEDALARHTRGHGGRCDAGDGQWPCQPYRLAVMVRDIEARCLEAMRQEGNTETWRKYEARAILAITREEK